jgi:hypothetical protein
MSELQILDRRSLLNGLKEQFLSNRDVATSKAENNRNQALRILFNRMDRMSDNGLLKTIKDLSEIGALDLTALTGIRVLEGRPPKVSIQQAFGLSERGSQPSLGERPASNPVKETGDLLEALELIKWHMESKGTHPTGHSREGE